MRGNYQKNTCLLINSLCCGVELLSLPFQPRTNFVKNLLYGNHLSLACGKANLFVFIHGALFGFPGDGRCSMKRGGRISELQHRVATRGGRAGRRNGESKALKRGKIQENEGGKEVGERAEGRGRRKRQGNSCAGAGGVVER